MVLSLEELADRLENRIDEALSTPRSQPAWLTISRAAEYTCLSEESIRKLLSTGKLVGRRPIRGRVLISRAELDDLIRGATSQPRTGRGIRQGGA